MLKKVRSIYSPLLVLSLVSSVAGLAGVAAGQQRAPSAVTTTRPAQQTAHDATTVFRSARDLITEGEWAKAQEKFDEYVKSFPNEKNIEAALYWLAYTQHKLARYEQVRTTIGRLLEKYPNTTWKDDARVLLAQAPGITDSVMAYQSLISDLEVKVAPLPPLSDTVVYAPVGPVNIAPMPDVPGVPTVWGMDGLGWTTSGSDDDPCEFKIVVLQALFQTDLQRGIMAATEWLKPGSTQTVRCKSAALSLLGRHGGKSVTPVILGVARSEPDVKLRARAISTLGATNDDSVIDPLRDFALNSQENEIIEAAVYALSKHTGERAIAVLTDIAKSGKTTAQRKLAISSISARSGEPAVDALFHIYETDQSIEIRKAVLSAFANRRSERAGNRLVEIARNSDNVELRKAAISAISRRGGDKAIEFLLSLYDTEKNEEVKDQIVNALGSGAHSFYAVAEMAGLAGTGQGIAFPTSGRMNDERVITKLIEIARDPKAPMERRKRAIGWLSRSKHPKVLEFLQELLKQ